MKYSVVIPIYNNQDSIPRLIQSLSRVVSDLKEDCEVIFINDASTDTSANLIRESMLHSSFDIHLIHHSRNFGSFSAIRTGISKAAGDYVGVISADLQEPPDLLFSFFMILQKKEVDIVFGTRNTRDDPRVTVLLSNVYWMFYRKFINKDIPKGGVDVFAFNKRVLQAIEKLSETNTSLIGLLFWIGFNREFVSYNRERRVSGKSSWTFKKKFNYMSDSIYSFSKLPIQMIQMIGALGSIISITLGSFLLVLSFLNKIDVPGYVPIMLAVLLGNSAILSGLGILGSYLWRTYENTQQRPFAIQSMENKED